MLIQYPFTFFNYLLLTKSNFFVVLTSVFLIIILVVFFLLTTHLNFTFCSNIFSEEIIKLNDFFMLFYNDLKVQTYNNF